MEQGKSLLLSHHIKPDEAFYVQSDDRLFVAAYSSVASLVVRFSGYFLDAHGEVNQYALDVAPTSDRAITSQSQIFGEGFLLSCIATLASGNANRGQCYIRARIQRGLGGAINPIAQLLAGYVTDDFSPSFPGGTMEGPLDGSGMLRSITGTNPAAGVEISETVPTGARWRVSTLMATLVTSSDVANRRVRILVDDGTNEFFRYKVATDQTATQTIQYIFAPLGTESGTAFSVAIVPIPPNLDLPAGARIRTNTSGLAAADDWGAPQLLVEEWMEA